MREAKQFRQVMKREGTIADPAVKGTTTGIVQAFDPVTQSAIVVLQPYGFTTGYIPVHTPWAGPGWGFFSPPAIGSFVTVQFEGGDIGTGHIIGRAHNEEHAPLPCPSGECWLVHASGTSIKLTNDGHAAISTSGDATLALGNNASLKKLVTDVFQDLFNGHTHPGIGVPPSQKITAAHLTTEIRGS